MSESELQNRFTLEDLWVEFESDLPLTINQQMRNSLKLAFYSGIANGCEALIQRHISMKEMIADTADFFALVIEANKI